MPEFEGCADCAENLIAGLASRRLRRENET
jgi:hypothetical protein